MKTEKDLAELLQSLKNGDLDVFQAVAQLASFQEDGKMGFAHVDHSRMSRCGFPEFIYGEGKSPEQILGIIGEIIKKQDTVLATRLSPEAIREIRGSFPEGELDETARIFLMRADPYTELKGRVMLVCAGTSDMPVALEAKYTAEACGCGTRMLNDVGVAGLHRIIGRMDALKNADVIIVAAGMEGALPSVVAGLVSCPVIALPTSVGYGTSLNGLTALFGMLNSCANGISVVNIDNGFGAGCAAARIINGAADREKNNGA